MADSLWSLFDGNDDGDEDCTNALEEQQPAPKVDLLQTPPLAVGVMAVEHPFFRDSTLWPPKGSRIMDLLEIQERITDDINEHLTPKIIQHIQDSADDPADAASLRSMCRAVLNRDFLKAKMNGQAFVSASATRLNSDRGDALEAWSMGLLLACSAVALCSLLSIRGRLLPEEHEAKLLAEESLWYLDTAIINSCRMQDGSSRWEFPYLKSVVGCLVQLAEQQLRAAPHLDDGSIALSEADTGAEIPGTLPAGAAPSISMENPVHTRHCSSLPVVLFLNKYLAARRPVVIQGYQEHCCWGALQSWGSLDFWRGRYGHRLVPVEVQRPGGESGGLRTMKLRDFITEFFLPSVHSQASGESVHGYGPYPRTVQQMCSWDSLLTASEPWDTGEGATELRKPAKAEYRCQGQDCIYLPAWALPPAPGNPARLHCPDVCTGRREAGDGECLDGHPWYSHPPPHRRTRQLPGTGGGIQARPALRHIQPGPPLCFTAPQGNS
mmetsp:Transcript_3537/g.10186  ORF Transcript_3537/g.10186 Transcript_3537/m.10186 type:complete len:495 (+) Transcript_3537:61-1545(+)